MKISLRHPVTQVWAMSGAYEESNAQLQRATGVRMGVQTGGFITPVICSPLGWEGSHVLVHKTRLEMVVVLLVFCLSLHFLRTFIRPNFDSAICALQKGNSDSPLSRSVINADEDFVCYDYVNIAFKWLLQNVCSCSATGGQDTLPFFPSLFSQSDFTKPWIRDS